MADRYPIRVEVGGEMLQEEYDEVFRQMEELNGCDATETEPTLAVQLDEATLSDVAELAQYCRDHQLHYELHCDAKYEFDGTLERWYPGLDRPKSSHATQAGEQQFCVTDLEQATEHKPYLTVNEFLAANAFQSVPDIVIVSTRSPVPERIEEPELPQQWAMVQVNDGKVAVTLHVDEQSAYIDIINTVFCDFSGIGLDTDDPYDLEKIYAMVDAVTAGWAPKSIYEQFIEKRLDGDEFDMTVCTLHSPEGAVEFDRSSYGNLPPRPKLDDDEEHDG